MPQFHCPHCGQLIDADDEFAGVEADCPTCEKEIRVPKLVVPYALKLAPRQRPVIPDRAAAVLEEESACSASAGSPGPSPAPGLGSAAGKGPAPAASAAGWGPWLWALLVLLASTTAFLLWSNQKGRPSPAKDSPALSQAIPDAAWVAQTKTSFLQAQAALQARCDKELLDAGAQELLTLESISRDPAFLQADKIVSRSKEALQRFRHDLADLAASLQLKVEASGFAGPAGQQTALDVLRFGLAQVLPLYQKEVNRKVELLRQARSAMEQMISQGAHWRAGDSPGRRLIFDQPEDQARFMLIVDGFAREREALAKDAEAPMTRITALLSALEEGLSPSRQLSAEAAQTMRDFRAYQQKQPAAGSSMADPALADQLGLPPLAAQVRAVASLPEADRKARWESLCGQGTRTSSILCSGFVALLAEHRLLQRLEMKTVSTSRSFADARQAVAIGRLETSSSRDSIRHLAASLTWKLHNEQLQMPDDEPLRGAKGREALQMMDTCAVFCDQFHNLFCAYGEWIDWMEQNQSKWRVDGDDLVFTNQEDSVRAGKLRAQVDARAVKVDQTRIQVEALLHST